MNTRPGLLLIAAVGLALSGCGRDATPAANTADPAAERPNASIYWERENLSDEELAMGRQDPSWRRVVQIDWDAWEQADTIPETADDITPEQVNGGAMYLPLAGEVAGPSVFRVQVLLDRALFSPGVIDGAWGKNTEKAVYWLQHREGLRTTGQVNTQTFERLVELAGRPQELVRRHQLTEEDVEGPFVTIPDDVYDQANLDCMCYESLREKLGERFHTAPALLEKLNPGVDLNTVAAGATLWVPNIRDRDARGTAEVTRLVVSDGGKYLHAMDAEGRIVYHFPTTLGSSYDPSPTGEFRVVRIAEDPWWHYQPSILAHVDSNKPEAKIPPGPNSPVGLVWMALSKPHYGIHGTNRPETIGYASSAGCVRLTNWDALFLSQRIEEGTTVTFRDT